MHCTAACVFVMIRVSHSASVVACILQGELGNVGYWSRTLSSNKVDGTGSGWILILSTDHMASDLSSGL